MSLTQFRSRQCEEEGASPAMLALDPDATAMSFDQHPGYVQAQPHPSPVWAPYFAERGWPVYVVDWPGIGRSGYVPDFLGMGSVPIVDALASLLKYIGPAVMLGHSMGGAMTFLTAYRAPEYVRAMVLVTASARANTSPVRPAVPLTERVVYDRAQARALLGESAGLSQDMYERYYRSLVPISPRIMNAALHQNEDFRIECPEVVRNRPILFIVAEHDLMVTPDRSGPASAFFGVVPTRVGADWGLPGHGHMLTIAPGNLEVAGRVAEWLETIPSDANR